MSEAHKILRMADNVQRQRARSRMDLPLRLNLVMARARTLSHAGAGQPGEGSRVKPSSRQPPPINSLQFTKATESVYDYYERRIRLMVEAYEREVDTVSQRPIEADLRFSETREGREKRLLVDYEGINSYEVAFIDRSFGSPRSIERTRVKHGRRGIDGSKTVH